MAAPGDPSMKHEKSAKLAYSPLVKARKARRWSGVMLVDMAAIPVWVGCTGRARRPRLGLRAPRPPAARLGLLPAQRMTVAGSRFSGGSHGGARTMGNCDPDEREIGLAPAPVRKGLPGSSIRGAEPRIICVDAIDWMRRCRRRTRSHYAYRQGKLCQWRRRAAEADGERARAVTDREQLEVDGGDVRSEHDAGGHSCWDRARSAIPEISPMSW